MPARRPFSGGLATKTSLTSCPHKDSISNPSCIPSLSSTSGISAVSLSLFRFFFSSFSFSHAHALLKKGKSRSDLTGETTLTKRMPLYTSSTVPIVDDLKRLASSSGLEASFFFVHPHMCLFVTFKPTAGRRKAVRRPSAHLREQAGPHLCLGAGRDLRRPQPPHDPRPGVGDPGLLRQDGGGPARRHGVDRVADQRPGGDRRDEEPVLGPKLPLEPRKRER